MGQDDAALHRIRDGVVVLVVGRRRFGQRHLEAEDVGVEGHRPLDVGDGHADVVDQSNGRTIHG